MSKGHGGEKGSLANTIKWKHINIHHHVNTEEYIIQVLSTITVRITCQRNDKVKD
jgi:hypothetical protein